ncbi:hypothetical protein C8J57DRAFT_1639188 [Mycena rebaudengoi]|nr:hypothetical protein C8J57DRAFT_1639188 [Mycena rebaudengoi]
MVSRAVVAWCSILAFVFPPILFPGLSPIYPASGGFQVSLSDEVMRWRVPHDPLYGVPVCPYLGGVLTRGALTITISYLPASGGADSPLSTLLLLPALTFDILLHLPSMSSLPSPSRFRPLLFSDVSIPARMSTWACGT